MTEVPYNLASFTRYWLGELPQAEQDRLEEEYFCRSELFLELLDAKNRLIRDYLSDRLSREQQTRFEQRFLTVPERREEVEQASFFQSRARAALAATSAQVDDAPSWWQAVFSAMRAHQPLTGLAFAMLLVAAVIGIQTMRQPQSADQPLAVVAPSPTPVPEGPAVVAIALRPIALVRANTQIPRAVIGAGTRTIKLMLTVGAERYRNYKAVLFPRDNPGQETVADSLQAETNAEGQRVVNWELSRLEVDDYQVVLSGVKADQSTQVIGTYYFDIREQ
jgi:hypothetical protein